MFIPDSDFYSSRITDPTPTPNHRKREGTKISSTIFCSHNEQKEIFVAKTLRIVVLFTKFVINLSKIWVWDPRSGKSLFRILDPRLKKAPDHGSGSATVTVILYI
jgi:hypothetical protein